MTPRRAAAALLAGAACVGCAITAPGARTTASPLPVEGHSARLAREHGAHPVDDPTPLAPARGDAPRLNVSPTRIDARALPATHPATAKRVLRRLGAPAAAPLTLPASLIDFDLGASLR